MSYLALYRRFRPTDFTKVIGQDAIVTTLTNQIKSDKVGHAYLFCGARGTGKTTLAKIFARAVNCLDSVNGSPCGKCQNCLALKDSSNLDVIEIDAASNNKVENVREIRDNVQYAPSIVKYKVYIIDEVHMLTTEAFNALLKTLEEPPKHAIFILATTEPHKLPATILSRCMRFDFRLVSTQELTSLICKIYDEIAKPYDLNAVKLIAKSGEGSVRDALSVADLCVSVGEGKLTYNDVLNVLGATDVLKTDALVKAIFSGDTGSVLSLTDELSSLGKSIGLLLKDLVNYLRDLAIIKTSSNAKDVLALPEDRYSAMKEVANLASEHRILRVIEIVSSIETSLRYSTQQRAVLETALIKATMPETDYNIDALIARITALESELKSLKENGVTIKEKVVEKVIEKPIEITVETLKEPIQTKKVDNDEGLVPPPEDGEIILQSPPKQESVAIKSTPKEVSVPTFNATNLDGKKIWGGIVRKLRSSPDKTILWVACQEMTASVEGTVLSVNANSESEAKLIKNPTNLNALLEFAKAFGITEVKVSVTSETLIKADPEKVKQFFGDTVTIK
ncbi:MAG: DNA polymerase III subunit gamma/tau [Clostridia bacterium]|nr:DNA polymerase III subunit gamma/tau [Clostridia bacterium]